MNNQIYSEELDGFSWLVLTLKYVNGTVAEKQIHFLTTSKCERHGKPKSYS